MGLSWVLGSKVSLGKTQSNLGNPPSVGDSRRLRLLVSRIEISVGFPYGGAPRVMGAALAGIRL
jgi:hypothetical protein